MTNINHWVLSAQDPDGVLRNANVLFDTDYTVFGLQELASQPASAINTVAVVIVDQALGTLALLWVPGPNISGVPDVYASVRNDWGYQVQFQAPNSADWITAIGGDEVLRACPTGDGGFTLYSPHFDRSVSINSNPAFSFNPACYPLVAWAAGAGQGSPAARFTAVGLDRNIAFDFLAVGKNASGLDFDGASLDGWSLSGCDVSSCDLSGCDLSGVTSMQGSNFSNANLTGTSLNLALMSGADCASANLSRCTLSGQSPGAPPTLTGASLIDAVVSGSLAGANMTNATLTNADFTGADLAGALLQGVDFTKATIRECNLTDADLSGANLSGLDLSTTSLVGANLSGANLSGATMGDADLSGTNLAGTDLSDTDLTAVTLPNPLTRSTDVTLPTSFANATLPYAAIELDWSFLDLTATNIVGLSNDLRGLVAEGTRRPGGSFAGYALDGANFFAATLTGADFTLATCTNATFSGAILTGAFFATALLDGTDFSSAALGGVSQTDAVDLSYAFIKGCTFARANMYGANLAGATLISDNVLTGADLQEADFSNAYLPLADFTDANLQGARFDGAFMVDCVLTNANLSAAEQGAVSASLAATYLQGAQMDGINLASANMTGAVLADAEGSLCQQYYDANGRLTEMTAMNYQASTFPLAGAFNDSTVCPNADTYQANVAADRTIPEMMTIRDPPATWTPVGEPLRGRNGMQVGAESAGYNTTPGWGLNSGLDTRSFTLSVQFDPVFTSIPTVQVALSACDVTGNIRLLVTAEYVTSTGFDMVFTTWGDSVINSARGAWIAFV